MSVSNKNYSNTIFTWEEVSSLDCFDIIWLDDWGGNLYEKKNYSKLIKSGKKIFAISPELHINENHPDVLNYKAVWKKLIILNVDGICTDYPLELKEVYEKFC